MIQLNKNFITQHNENKTALKTFLPKATIEVQVIIVLERI